MNISKLKRFSLAITALIVMFSTVFAVSSNVRAAAVCSPATAISSPFAKDGAGDFCWEATSLCAYINSWNTTALEINGTPYNNVYVASSAIPAVNGKYIIHYNSAVAWSHFEIAGTCGGSGPTNTPTVSTPTGPTNTPTTTPTTGPSPTPGIHLANPFAGANMYVNHDWRGSETFDVNTFLWLDTIDAIHGTNGYAHSLEEHMDMALAQGRNAITIVVYNLPNRDCSALASNGELFIAQNGFNRYKTEYVDAIYAVVSQPKYSGLRIIAVIEPDSLPNLITNYSMPKCQEAMGAGGYVQATQYTLNKFYPLRNFYSYIDIGHAGWLGWSSNFGPAVTLISDMIKGTTAGVNSVDGFIDNTANTQVETETFLDANTTLTVGGLPVRASFFFSWNDYIDESHFAAAWQTAMQAKGLPASSTNMLLDTSRNGWGGCGGGPFALQTCRPTSTSTNTTSLDAYVNESRIDRRPAKGDWCNQNGAGIGKLPSASALPPFQAYVWVKPPGESDGSSSLIPVGPDNPGGKGFDRMCDPTYGGNSLNQQQNTNALPNAPVSGAWFQAQFDQLVANRFPGGALPPTATVTRTSTTGPTVTRTITSTTGPTITRTRTVTAGPSLTRTRTATAGPSLTSTRTIVVPTNTNTNVVPTNTVTKTATQVPSSTATLPNTGACTNPTLLTSGGTYPVSAAGTCFKYVDANFRWGAMISVRNMAADTNTVSWFGARDEGQSACSAQSQVLTGTNGQLNNFVVPKDTSNAMYVTILPAANTTVQISFGNWQNGTGCLPPPTATPTATNTFTPGPTRTPTRTPTFGPSPTSPPTPVHLANPFAGANMYVNHDWRGSETFNVNTFLWLDSIDAVNGTNGYPHSLADHMDMALAQGRNAITIVIYDLPNRDCSALASNGELFIAQNGFNRYKTEYIDPIHAVLSQPKYYGLRIIAVIEPDSLPNLITNTNKPKCQEAQGAGGYVQATQYTLNKLQPLKNFYSYIDIGHAGWLGWPSNFGPAITLISNMIKGTNAGASGVDGFIDNTANTQVETETYLDANTTLTVGGLPVRASFFFSWNDYIDESHFATAWKAAMQAAGLPASSTNMLLDTSRNGWGGCGGGPFALQTCRPTSTSTNTTSLDAYVNASRIDRRPAKGDWCNQNGAGIGKLPSATALAPFQAYVWVKPPGESDGSSSLVPTGPDNPGGKGFDRMCDPTYGGNDLNQNQNSNALPNAPVSGAWFQAQFDQLVANKFP